MAEQPPVPSQPMHETRDVNIRLLVLSGLGLLALLVGGLALVAWLFGVFNVRPEGQGLRGAPLAASRPRAPGPGLQTRPRRDLQEFRRDEAEQLQGYTWLDRSAGVARIPLEQALALVAERGLPAWQELPAPAPGSPPPSAEGTP